VQFYRVRGEFDAAVAPSSGVARTGPRIAEDAARPTGERPTPHNGQSLPLKRGIAMTDKIRPDELAKLLAGLHDWKQAAEGNAITRSIKFADFNEAFGFMTRVAIKAQEMDHHPEWSNVYDRVDITLSTHDADGVTEKDAELARFIDSIAPKR
jgi:4a-hydroxytetrahydrobiopterin dehydratase